MERRSIVPAMPGFNPRAREGRDLCSSIYMTHAITVSIHAPARGATDQDISAH